MNERIKELAEQAGFECWKDEPYRPEGQVIDWASNYDEELEKFAELVRADEREACAKLVEADGLARGAEGLVFIKAAGRIRARGEKPWVKTYAGGKPNYCTPVDNVYMSEERVHKTDKSIHEEKNK